MCPAVAENGVLRKGAFFFAQHYLFAMPYLQMGYLFLIRTEGKYAPSGNFVILTECEAGASAFIFYSSASVNTSQRSLIKTPTVFQCIWGGLRFGFSNKSPGSAEAS